MMPSCKIADVGFPSPGHADARPPLGPRERVALGAALRRPLTRLGLSPSAPSPRRGEGMESVVPFAPHPRPSGERVARSKATSRVRGAAVAAAPKGQNLGNLR